MTDTDKDHDQNKTSKYLLIMSALLAAACLGCLLLSSPPILGVGLPPDMPVQVCAGFATTPRWQAGFYWTSLVFSYIPSLATSPYVACLDVPPAWIPTNLPRQVAFPP
jgi:hypothetical protein